MRSDEAALISGEEDLECGHAEHEDCMNCVSCGLCREDLDEDDLCVDCGGECEDCDGDCEDCC